MKKGDKEWRKLASAFYSLAHNDRNEFDALEPKLRNTEVGRLCMEFIQSGDFQLIHRAGVLLTGTEQWYVYLGRSM